MKKIVTLISLVMLGACSPCPEKPTTPTFTDVTIENCSKEDSVQVYVTLQSTESVIGMFGITDTSVAMCKGSFWAIKGEVYHINRTTPVFGAIVSFGGDNQACAAAISHGFIWGINNFEFTTSIANECFDISCEDGCNSIIRTEVTDTVNWNTGQDGYLMVFKQTQNQFPLDNNIGIRGVYPYRCTDCIRDPNPLENCFSLPDNCSTIRVCNVNRSNAIGGTIKCKYLGKAFEILK